MTQINFNRQVALWGRQGQEILSKSSVAVQGLNTLGIEVVKALVTLGVDNISIFDNRTNTESEHFLDIQLRCNASTAETIDKLVRQCFKKDCNIRPYHAPPSLTFLGLQPLDAIVDCTNNPVGQAIALDAADLLGIAAITACADTAKGEFSFYLPGRESNCQPLIRGYEGKEQGRIISNLLCGMIVEEVRKYLFKSKEMHVGEWKIVKELIDFSEIEQNNGLWFKPYDYRQMLETEHNIQRNIFHNLNGVTAKQRSGREALTGPSPDDEFDIGNHKVLVLGGGAIGNYLAMLLAGMDNLETHFVDFDIYKDHNIVRQHLAYDRLLCRKSAVLSEKIRKINPRILSTGIIGFVGEEYDVHALRESDITPEEVQLVNQDFIRHEACDIIFGCFDRMSARRSAAIAASSLGIPYIDGGSGAEPTESSVSIYLPGRSDECLSRQFTETRPSQRRLQEEFEQYTRAVRRGDVQGVVDADFHMQGQGCGDFVAGSVSMGNQIAAALMAAEARRILNPQAYGQCNMSCLDYLSSRSRRIDMREK